jgi:hypothetical protein
MACPEGAVRHIDCTIVSVCDNSGSCTLQSGKVIFRLAPIATAPDGSVSAPMQALSDAGPFHWKVGEEQNTLLLNSDREMLWHQLNIRGPLATKVRFMTGRYQP